MKNVLISEICKLLKINQKKGGGEKKGGVRWFSRNFQG
jgi:hypothetical protein